jgi:hypothetical protein
MKKRLARVKLDDFPVESSGEVPSQEIEIAVVVVGVFE